MTKKGADTKTTEPVLRKATYAPGKRATLVTKPGFPSCTVLEPVGVGPKGGIVFGIAIRIQPLAGKITFVPRGKETLVVDAPVEPSRAAITRLLKTSWGKKGGDPPTVIDHGHGGPT